MLPKLEPTLVEQRTPYDCSVCCFAMLFGVSYEEAYAKTALEPVLFNPQIEGLADEISYLARFGMHRGYASVGTPDSDYVHNRIPYDMSSKSFRDRAWGRRALMTVPSLNNPGRLHMIFTWGIKVFDPSTRQRYTEWKQLEPIEMVLFNEI